MIPDDEIASFEAFRDSVSTTVIARLAPSPNGSRKRAVKGRKNEIKPVVKAQTNDDDGDDAGELSDFFLAEEMFASLPSDLRSLSYAAIQDDPSLKTKYDIPLDPSLLTTIVDHLPPTTSDSLQTYALIPSPTDLDRFLQPILESYIATTTSPPPEYTPALTATRPAGCEICAREHLPLTYHHLIPRQMHAKAVKRGWHREWELQRVAWLCRACHSYLHRVATNEELARKLYSVELVMERKDVVKWANWVGRVRWKAR
ncbi:hypothetical protein B0A54_05439 [Friedmanniomyces endolithicus]|uniref:HNH domain-containing protein n=1 Tax=Friedmanniomyces endolithicus TaxID=329885 RepID=A0A4U0V6Y8_9PEZI|nr:hypothetical protein B0A54_05439 [Friedmanniomyces endolithicus]